MNAPAPAAGAGATALTAATGGLALSEDAVFADFAARVPLAGAHVVEIGGSLSENLAELHGVGRWTSVDPNRPAGAGPSGRTEVVRARAEDMPLPDASADAVFSSNAFQFIDVTATLAQVRRVLRPGGLLYAHFGPIWSAVDGHQLEYVSYEGRDLLFWQDTLLPPWAHLAYDRAELRQLLGTALPDDLADLLVWHVYDSATVNRLFFEDYVEAVLHSGLDLVEARASHHLDYELRLPAFDPQHLREVTPAELAATWTARRGRPTRVGARDVLLVLRQPIE
ncbi:class I SAM-dependent methyltransferase [Micromonospora olivasterospora]|uniref:Methyltransferase family protein n=1 Tax=Micromonospora olivasterospora TaxID=1880 RepID=Q2MFZ6_MICOL|nr:class I SAM-dependent methyltransferase [Micromonospora olivasterospora]TWH67107.1 methyltransferase family protein [Micromonospora olivasterospora]CAF31551.1 putative fortimicin N-methyltransferase [Micromonospora olivasterospora]